MAAEGSVGFSLGDRAGGSGKVAHWHICCVTFSQAPSLSGALLLSFVKFEGSSHCSSSLPLNPGLCRAPDPLSCSTSEASPSLTENQSQEANELLRPLVKCENELSMR